MHVLHHALTIVFLVLLAELKVEASESDAICCECLHGFERNLNFSIPVLVYNCAFSRNKLFVGSGVSIPSLWLVEKSIFFAIEN